MSYERTIEDVEPSYDFDTAQEARRDGEEEASPCGEYDPKTTYLTLVKRGGDNRYNRDRANRLQHKHHVSLSENVFYKKTVELTTMKTKLDRIALEIKALSIMRNEKTVEDDLYEPESELLRAKYKEYTTLKKKYDKKAKEFRESLNKPLRQ